jgi:hypothetical protein
MMEVSDPDTENYKNPTGSVKLPMAPLKEKVY